MDLGLLYYHEFESLCTRLLVGAGFKCLEQPGRSQDIGINLLLLTPAGEKWVVVLKHNDPLVMINAYLRDATNLLADARDFLRADTGLLIFSGKVPAQVLESLDRSKGILLWDEPVLHDLLNKHTEVCSEFLKLLEQQFLIEKRIPKPVVKSARAEKLAARLEYLSRGEDHWRDFDDLCINILNYAFIPPFRIPKIQDHLENGIFQRTATYVIGHGNTIWDTLKSECQTRLVIAKFNNYSYTPGQPDVELMQQSLSTKSMKSLGFLCSRLPPSAAALTARRQAWLEYNKLVIFLSADNLKDILQAKALGRDPAEILEIELNEFFTSLNL